MKKIYLAAVFHGDQYTCFYTQDGLETIDLYADGVRHVEWEVFDEAEDIDEFFDGWMEDIRNHVPRFFEEDDQKYEKHWLFSIKTEEYYPGFCVENWIETAEELGEVICEEDALAAYYRNSSRCRDDVNVLDNNKEEYLTGIAQGLLQIGLKKWPVEGNARQTSDLSASERIRLFREAYADIITTPAWGEKSELRLICEDAYRFMMITMAKVADDKAEEVFETAVKRWEKADYVLSDTIIEMAKNEIETWMKRELPEMITEKLDYHSYWEMNAVQQLFSKTPYMPAGETVSVIRERVDGPLLAAVMEAYVPISDRRVCEGLQLIWRHLSWVFREVRKYTAMPDNKWRMVGNPTYRHDLLEDLFAHTIEQEWALTWVDQMYDAVLEELDREEQRICGAILNA